MTLEELTHIFRFQLTESETYTPKDTLDYILLHKGNRVEAAIDKTKLESFLADLESHGYVFDAYRDRTPVFIVPEIITVL
jgi:hypothetical protein